MEIITNRDQIKSAQQVFSGAIETLSNQSFRVALGFQRGYLDETVNWIADLNLWARFGPIREGKSPGNRYWNVFGIGHPSGNTNIDCEINPPLNGRNRRTGGVYLLDSDGNYFVGHRGNFNANGRIPYDFVFSNFNIEKVSVQDGRPEALVLLIGQLNAPSFPKALQTFVLEAMRVKNLAREDRKNANT